MAKIPQLLAEYLSPLPPKRERVQALRKFIVAQYPEAQFSSKYKIPTYKYGGGVSVARQKHYVSQCICARKYIQPYIEVEAHPDVKFGTGCLYFRGSDAIREKDLILLLQPAFGSGEPGSAIGG
ncbi:DUF1801 domain-containing protein [Microbulbifer bruguierae]|uniref:DUF1801 domain-containing protein n=1 Tax=Microbulbifer bruguierae TaxID=3029061 RepID=A0ABY8NFF0_9GAMM|nr:DUF1801 domain-containing protein [Microbulbifer bruguierae]WGL17663.1 DUF1801 domain-containing protein [Microbulbifer bruguierae]